ncbi:MAG: putative sulfate exporter family transporter [Chloroflexota bacterium]
MPDDEVLANEVKVSQMPSAEIGAQPSPATQNEGGGGTAVVDRPNRKKTGLSAHLAKYLPGLILVLVIGLAAYRLASLHQSLDALALAIMLSITVRLLVSSVPALARPAQALLPGAQLGVRVLIPVGIILYGVNLDFTRLVGLPLPTIALTLLSMGAFYVLIFWLNRFWGLSSKLSELIATGSAICGASAIAVLSPSIDAEPEDTSVSLLVITAAGLLGVMIYPLLKELLVMSDRNFAVLSGATLHQTGLVRVAVSSLPPDTANLGMAVKTLRIVMLAPVALITGFFHALRRTSERGLHPEGASTGKTSPAAFVAGLLRVWFLLPFVLVGFLISFVPASRSYLTVLRPWATIAFSIALASIGFMVDIESVLNTGSRPLLIGLIGWLGVIMLFFVLAPFLL